MQQVLSLDARHPMTHIIACPPPSGPTLQITSGLAGCGTHDHVWAAGAFFAAWIGTDAGRTALAGRRVLDLVRALASAGLPALLRVVQPPSMTDLPVAVPLLQRNIDINKKILRGCDVTAGVLRMTAGRDNPASLTVPRREADDSSLPQPPAADGPERLVLGCDTMYNDEMIVRTCQTAARLLHQNSAGGR